MMGLVFGAVALVTVAVCLIALLIQRTEQQKLKDRVGERDDDIKAMQFKVDGANRERISASNEAKRSTAMLESFQVARAQENEDWKRRIDEVLGERDALQDVADKVKNDSQRLVADAKQALKRTDVPNLPLRPNGLLIDSKTVFADKPRVKLTGKIPNTVAADLGTVITDAMLERKVALSQTAGAAIRLEAVARTSAATPKEISSVVLTAELQQLFVSTDLASLVWVSTIVESDLVASTDDTKVADLVKQKTKELTLHLLDRAYGPLVPAAAPAGAGGSAAPANPNPAVPPAPGGTPPAAPSGTPGSAPSTPGTGTP